MLNTVTTTFASGAAHRSVPSNIADALLAIEHIYTLYAGPIAEHLVPEVYLAWVSNNQPRLATLLRYARQLAATLPDHDDRERFIRSASETILTPASMRSPVSTMRGVPMLRARPVASGD